MGILKSKLFHGIEADKQAKLSVNVTLGVFDVNATDVLSYKFLHGYTCFPYILWSRVE